MRMASTDPATPVADPEVCPGFRSRERRARKRDALQQLLLAARQNPSQKAQTQKFMTQ